MQVHDRDELFIYAVVVLDIESREVRALLGSPDFFDRRRRGFVNGAAVRRSAGSTLKPFLYALAFDRGVLGPSVFLPDVPTVYSGYAPENTLPERRARDCIAAGSHSAWRR